jgi:hypothetical protein
MNCKQIYIKDKQIKYVHWKNTHKVEENGGLGPHYYLSLAKT